MESRSTVRVKTRTGFKMGLIYGYLFVVTSVLLHTDAHDRRYHGVSYHVGNINLTNKHVLLIDGKPVCNEGFSMLDAAIVCRQTGRDSSHVNIIYNDALKANRSLIGEGCRGHETRLQQCYFGVKAGCRRTVPVSIMCDEEKDFMKNTTITVLPSDTIRVYRGTNVTVTCSAEGLYMPSQYWYTWTLANGTVVGSSPSVSLPLNERFPVKTNLTCSVSVRNQHHKNASINLQVFGDPPPLNKTSYRNVGEKLDFDEKCNPPCNCSWRKVKSPNHVDQRSSDTKSCSMAITNTSQTGLYIVTRENYLSVTIGQPRKGISVDVIELQVSDKPTIDCPPQQYVTRTDYRPHQMCRFQSPWSIENCTGNTQPSCPNCSIEINESHNSGNYTCTASYWNKRLNKTNSTVFNISVHILDTNWTVSVMAGSNIDLNSNNCTGNDPKQFKWKHLSDNGQAEDVDYSHFSDVTESANYVGFLKNEAKALMRLEVLHSPEVTCDSKISRPRDTRVNLNCSVNATPESSNVTWTRNGEVIRYTTSGTLDLGYIGMGDGGRYICTAYNTMVDCYNETREGNGSCTITLDVYVDGDKTTVTVVASVLSLLLVCLMVVVGVLSGLLHMARTEERRKTEPPKMLPLLSTPVKHVPPSDIYENT